MSDFRIKIDDVRLFPVQAAFNSIPDDSFLKCFNDLSNGIGFGCNEAGCSFPSDLDPGDTPFSGVSFYVLTEEVVISLNEFRHYARLAAESYVSSHPEHQRQVQILLDHLDSHLKA